MTKRKATPKTVSIKDETYTVVGRYLHASTAAKAVKRLGPPHTYAWDPTGGRRMTNYVVIKPHFEEKLFESPRTL